MESKGQRIVCRSGIHWLSISPMIVPLGGESVPGGDGVVGVGEHLTPMARARSVRRLCANDTMSDLVVGGQHVMIEYLSTS